MRSWWSRAVRVLAVLGAVALIALVVARVALAEPRPEGTPGPDAEALADRIETAVGQAAWERTGALEFTFLGQRYLWDRERNLVRVEDGKGVVLTEGWRPMGRAFRQGRQVGGRWKDRRVRSAYERFVNDAFWVFAPNKLRDAGAVREVAPGGTLLVRYPTGGVTPGDVYRWELGPDGTPVAWSIWARVLPLPGARFTWDDWVTLPTGLRVATVRRAGPVTLKVDDLDAAEHLSELWPGEDPFAPMFGP